MLTIQSGNLLESDCNIIAHQCNCFGKMGAGLAKQIKKRYPEVAIADQKGLIPIGSKKRLGTVTSAIVENGKRVVFNLYGQYRYGTQKQQTDYEAFEKALEQMFFVINRQMHLHQLFKEKVINEEPFWEQDWNPKWRDFPFDHFSIGIPYGIGCGLGGGDWSKVEEILFRASEKYHHPIHLYKL